MNEEQIVWSLISGKIESFKSKIFDCVHEFYLKYDPTKSLDKSFILSLISQIHVELDFVLDEVKNG